MPSLPARHRRGAASAIYLQNGKALNVGEQWPILVVGALVSGVGGVLIERILGRPWDRLWFRFLQRWGGRTGSPKTLNGIWRSRFTYWSSGSPVELEDEYLVVLKQDRHSVTGRSLSRKEGSRLTLDLELDRSALTGIWREYTPDRKRSYLGSCQLLINLTADRLDGKWMGFRQDGTIGDGPWEWRRIDNRVSRRAQRTHRDTPGLAWRQQVGEATGAPID
jgi:hypothetical protein